MTATRAKRVFIDEVANALPVGKWFDKLLFAELTGIDQRGSANQRLKQLTDKKLLDTKNSGRKRMWRMSAKQKAEMITQAEELEQRKKVPRKSKVGYVRTRDGKWGNAAAIEEEAYKEHGWRTLRKAGLI